MKLTLRWLPALMATAACFAGETRIWTQGDYSDFEKGVIKNLSLRSDGLLTLAPRSRELFDTAAAYLWALAQDSKGNLYAGGGTGAKLYRIRAGWQGQGAGRTRRARDPRHRGRFARIASTPPRRPTARSTASPATANPKSSTIPKRSTSGRMAFDSKGNLYVATGDQGEIHGDARRQGLGLFQDR